MKPGYFAEMTQRRFAAANQTLSPGAVFVARNVQPVGQVSPLSN